MWPLGQLRAEGSAALDFKSEEGLVVVRRERIDLRDPKADEEFAPKPDPMFNHMVIDALRGRLPVYFAVISFDCFQRSDPTHRPEATVSGKQFVMQVAGLPTKVNAGRSGSIRRRRSS